MTIPSNAKIERALRQLDLELPETEESERLLHDLEVGLHEVLHELRTQVEQFSAANVELRGRCKLYEYLAQSLASVARNEGQPADLARAALHAVAGVRAIERGHVILFSRENGAPHLVETLGAREADDLCGSVSTAILERLRTTGEEQYFADAREQASSREVASVRQMQLRTVFCVPVPGMERPRGALYVENRSDDDAFDQEVKDIVRMAASSLAYHLDLLYSDPPDGEPAESGLLHGFQEFVGVSRSTRLLLGRVRRFISQTPLPVLLLTGHTGVGKTHLARLLHEGSPRREGPFVRVSLPNLQPGTMERELFGAVEGAYTDARKAVGLIESARGGTLLLDEIGATPLDVQAKLLQFLDDGLVRPVGGTSGQIADVWVIVATNADLEALYRLLKEHDVELRE